jgi:hypothetical protein
MATARGLRDVESSFVGTTKIVAKTQTEQRHGVIDQAIN